MADVTQDRPDFHLKHALTGTLRTPDEIEYSVHSKLTFLGTTCMMNDQLNNQ